MNRTEIIEFLVQTMNIQMVEEYKTTDHKDYIKQCIESKAWLLKQLHKKDNLFDALDCANDVDKYIKES